MDRQSTRWNQTIEYASRTSGEQHEGQRVAARRLDRLCRGKRRCKACPSQLTTKARRSKRRCLQKDGLPLWPSRINHRPVSVKTTTSREQGGGREHGVAKPMPNERSTVCMNLSDRTVDPGKHCVPRAARHGTRTGENPTSGACPESRAWAQRATLHANRNRRSGSLRENSRAIEKCLAQR